MFLKQQLWYALNEEVTMTAISKDLSGTYMYLDGSSLYKDWSYNG